MTKPLLMKSNKKQTNKQAGNNLDTRILTFILWTCLVDGDYLDKCDMRGDSIPVFTYLAHVNRERPSSEGAERVPRHRLWTDNEKKKRENDG